MIMDLILHLLIKCIKHFKKIVFLSLVLPVQGLGKESKIETLDL